MANNEQAPTKPAENPALKREIEDHSRRQIIIDSIASIEHNLAVIRETLQAVQAAEDRKGLGDACGK